MRQSAATGCGLPISRWTAFPLPGLLPVVTQLARNQHQPGQQQQIQQPQLLRHSELPFLSGTSRLGTIADTVSRTFVVYCFWFAE